MQGRQYCNKIPELILIILEQNLGGRGPVFLGTALKIGEGCNLPQPPQF